MDLDKPKIRIGLISEHAENDGMAVADLLKRYFPNQAEYISLHNGGAGDRIDTSKFRKLIKENWSKFQPDMLLIIRDLDDDDNKKMREAFFSIYKKELKCIPQTLLFVYKIEALAVIDFETTQAHYGEKIKHGSKPNNSKGIKNQLKELFAYSTSDMRDLVSKFDKTILYQNYPTWKKFINDFEKLFGTKALF